MLLEEFNVFGVLFNILLDVYSFKDFILSSSIFKFGNCS